MGDTPECLVPRPLCMSEMVEAKQKDKGRPLTSEGEYAHEQSIGSQLAERGEHVGKHIDQTL